MNRRTRREDGREEKQSSIEFEHLLDAVRGARLPPPLPPAPPAELDVDVDLLIESGADIDVGGLLPLEPAIAPTPEPEPPAAGRSADVSINDDLLPAPRRRRWGRR